MFFVQYFMTQIETLFFGGAFPVLTKPDIILIMLAGLFPLLGTVPLLVKFFKNKNIVYEKSKINIKDITIKLAVIGILYLCVYMVFGYFVAWQSEELRLFYTGSTEKLSFWGQMANNIKTNTVIIPFQILRGILFGVAIIPLRNMVNKNKIIFIINVCLIYLCTAIVLIIPNALFPDKVRIAHLIEMSSSMLFFGIIVGNIYGKKIKAKKKLCITYGLRFVASLLGVPFAEVSRYAPSTAHSTHIFPALVFASQSHYPGWKKIVILSR
jgi:hypothetical protein